MATPVRIQSGDSGYTDLYNLWVAEGSPAQFDSMGAEGGHLYYVTNRKTTPVFHVMASAGPTLYDENSASAGPSQEGWVVKMPKHGQLTFTRDFHTGWMKVKKDELPRE